MEKKKMNDKGFSLVELIIVIAIMAILIGVLAPQYLKFVERSRKSTDKDTVDQIIRAVQIDAADPMTTNNPAGMVTLTPSSVTVTTTNATGDLATILTNAGIDKIQLKSSKWTNADAANNNAIYIHFREKSDGNIEVAVTGSSSTPATFTTTISDGAGGTLITE